MLSGKQVRDDLKEIRYYYSMQQLFTDFSKVVMPAAILEKVKKYNAAAENAPARMYIVYISLYINNNSQATLAEEWGFTREYIRDLNQKLVAFFQKAFN